MSRTRRKKAPGLRKPANGGKKQQAKSPESRNPKPRSPDTSTSLTSSDSTSEDPFEGLTNEWAARARLPVEIRPEIFDMFEAILYCTYLGYLRVPFPPRRGSVLIIAQSFPAVNGHIYPNLAKTLFGPSDFVIPMAMVDGVPAPIIHTLVSVVLSHRIIQLAEHPASDQLVKPLWARLYRHRDIAVKAINKRVGDEIKRKELGTIVSVYTLLFAMVSLLFLGPHVPHIIALGY
jgi:hypothetical protein